jgi:hypothetical protein
MNIEGCKIFKQSIWKILEYSIVLLFQENNSCTWLEIIVLEGNKTTEVYRLLQNEGYSFKNYFAQTNCYAKFVLILVETITQHILFPKLAYFSQIKSYKSCINISENINSTHFVFKLASDLI